MSMLFSQAPPGQREGRHPGCRVGEALLVVAGPRPGPFGGTALWSDKCGLLLTTEK